MEALWIFWPISGLLITGFIFYREGMFSDEWDMLLVSILVLVVCGAAAGPFAIVVWYLNRDSPKRR